MSAGEVCVIFNPRAGRQLAARRLGGLRRAWGEKVTFRQTVRPGQGVELGRSAAEDGFTVVAAAGGDGTVHEVANGVLQAGRPGVTFAVLPLGSANDYAHSLEHRRGADGTRPGPVDVGLVRDERGHERYFVCCLGLGLNGAVTLESRRIHRLRGLALYGLATLRALWYHYACPRVTLSIDGDAPWTARTLMLSVLLGRREGSFVMAPSARLDDGLFDYVHAGDLSRWEVLRYLPRLAKGGPPADHAKVRLGQCRQMAVRSEAPLIVHLDGEFFCRPEDDVRQLEIRLLPAALQACVLGTTQDVSLKTDR